jgi:uncharacterized protein (DUF1697 family)
MPVYISMLRGINVGKNKRMKMDALRRSFEALGFEQVKTYIQSGNVVFKTAKRSSSALSKRIEERILSDFGFSSSVISRTGDELRQMIENNPFFKRPEIDPAKLHVMFLSAKLAPSAIKRLETLTTKPDESRCCLQEIYLYLPNGASESSLMKSPLDRALSVVTTTRNWNTVNKLYEMSLSCA